MLAICSQCVSLEDVIFTVHIRYVCLRCLREAKQESLSEGLCISSLSSFFWMCCKEQQKKGHLALKNQENFLINGRSYLLPS